MTATNQNIAIYAGDDFEVILSLFESDGTTPLDLTGAVVNWALSSVYDIQTPLIEKSSAIPGQVTITNIAGGLVSIFLGPADTADLGGQPYYHEVEVVQGGTTVTVLTGGVTINETALN
jgi:hypothetical protein